MTSFFGINERIAQLECPAFRRRLSWVYRELGFDGFGLDLRQAAKRLRLEVSVNARFPFPGQIWTLPRGQRVVGLKHRPDRGRARFTFAHEISHELVRIEWFGLVDRNAYRFSLEDVEEPFCDFIAGLLLMPLPAFFPRVFQLAQRYPNINQYSYKRLADDFRVSVSSAVLQITLLKSFRFLYETYDYGSTPPRTDRVANQSSDQCFFSGRWDHLRDLVPTPKMAGKSNPSFQLSHEVIEQTARSMASASSACRACAKINKEHCEPTTDWENDSDVIVLERTGQYTQLRHLLRPRSKVQSEEVPGTVD